MATQVTVNGRIVWAGGASPLDQTEVMDDRTKQPKVDAQGNKVLERSFGLAIPKNDPTFAPLWNAMQQEAAKVCNGVIPEFNNNGQYAYKIIDGDGMDKGDLARGRQPQPYSRREGYGGCWVITIKSQLPNPPPVYMWDGGTWKQVDHNNISGNKLKVGDYVQVGLSVDGHGGQSPGNYLNPQGIQFVGFGTAIQRGPDASAMFGAGPAPLPPGATATPQSAPAGAPAPMPGSPAPAPAPAAPPAAPGGPAPLAAPAAAPAPASPAAPPNAGGLPTPGNPTASPSSTGPAPLPGFAAGTPGQPAPAPAPAAPPAPPAAPERTPAGYQDGKPYYAKADGSGFEW